MASVIALADTSCGNASIAHLPKGALGFTTIEIKSNHIGTMQEGRADSEIPYVAELSPDGIFEKGHAVEWVDVCKELGAS